MNISFIYSEDKSEIYLEYQVAYVSNFKWVIEKIRKEKKVEIKRIKRIVFTFTEEDFLEEESAPEVGRYIFKFAKVQGDYYKISNHILSIDDNVFLSLDLQAIPKYFINYQASNPSIFSSIHEICNQDIYIGGSNENAIPKEDFELLVENFPKRHETKLYAQSRIFKILGEFLYTMIDSEVKFQKFFQNKKKRLGTLITKVPSIPKGVYESEVKKYVFIKKEFEKELKKGNYDEGQWKTFVKHFLLLIFPQYIDILEFVKVPEIDSEGEETIREIDFVLVNANGCIDIMEIKQPSEYHILSTGNYRDNFYPHRVLADSIMQAEKYIFYLNNYGAEGERKLNEKYKDSLPKDFKLKIRNPKAFILFGRSNNFDDRQKSDFEIIKRKYANMIDIISYDDLLNRLENIIAKLQSKQTSP